jgi:hypothetical protein
MLVESVSKEAASDSASSTSLVERDDDTAPLAARDSSLVQAPWFKKKASDGKGAQDQMFEHADEHMHKIFLARDGYMGNKEYASCEEHEEVAELLLHCYVKAEPCNLYELIRDGNQCKLYADVEWHGPSNDNHNARLNCFLNKIKSSVQVGLSLYILIF